MSFVELKAFWSVDRPWQSASRFEPVYIAAGKQLYNQSMNLQRRLLRLKKHSTSIEGFNMTWLTQSKPLRGRPTLLLIHGLSGDKDNWLLTAKYLIKQYNLLIVDLPSHGETGYLAEQSYSTHAQVRRLFKLLDFLHLDSVHIAGHSMGGFIATMMALTAPIRVQSLTLISAAGMLPKSLSALEQGMEVGNNAFITHSMAGYQQFMQLAVAKPIWMPKAVALMLAKKNYVQREIITKCLSEILPEIFVAQTMTQRLYELTMPVLLIWGQQDQLIGVGIMHQIAELLPHAKTLALDNVGHLALVEKPKVTAKRMLKFLAVA